MVFFNDPVPCDDPPARAVRMAVAMRERVAELADGWARRGHDLGFGAGIAQGYATLGRIGFEGRFDYAAIGSVTNLAARLCAEAATCRFSSATGFTRAPRTSPSASPSASSIWRILPTRPGLRRSGVSTRRG